MAYIPLSCRDSSVDIAMGWIESQWGRFSVPSRPALRHTQSSV